MPYPTRLYLVEQLIPVRSITIISGSSGSGKSRLVFQLCEEWYNHALFFGRKAMPNPRILYLCYDRTIEDVYDTLNDMGIYLPQLTIRSMLHSVPLAPPSILPDDIDLLIIDGLDCLVKNVNDFHEVCRILQHFMRLTINRDIAVIGIVGASKLKEGERYNNARERTLGSSAWSRLTGSHINLEFNPSDPRLIRKVHLSPRYGGPGEILEMAFNDQNRLVKRDKAARAKRTEWIEELLTKLPATFSTSEALDAGEALGKHEVTIKKALSELVDDQRLERTEHGFYLKISVN